MAYNNSNNSGGSYGRGPNIKNDKFGNAYQLKVAEAVVDKKTGAVLPIFKTHVELGGKLYKIEVSDCKKETKNNRGGMWVKVTHVNKQNRATSM